MDESILNVEQAMEFLGISEKTLIKLLREEHIPARKIGREWRFSKSALIAWLSTGDSLNYINRTDYYRTAEDIPGRTADLLKLIESKTGALKIDSHLRPLLKLEKDIDLPDNATLRVSYKQLRDIEKLSFKIFWPVRDEYRNLGREESSGTDSPELSSNSTSE